MGREVDLHPQVCIAYGTLATINAFVADAPCSCHSPPFFSSMNREPTPKLRVTGAHCLLNLGDSITTDHISPAGNISIRSPAARYLIDRGYATST